MRCRGSLRSLLVAAAASTACSSGGGTGSPPVVKLAFVTNNASEFWKIAAAGVRKYEAEGQVQVDVKMPPNGTPEEQNQILENLASQGYDAIAVSAVAPNDQVPVLNRVAAKTALITFDSDAPASNRLLYIGTNNYEAGRVLGGEIVKLLPSGGNMAVFVGTFSADNAAQRFKGIQDAIAATRSTSSIGARTAPIAPRRARTSRTSSTRIAISTSWRACGPTTDRRSPRRSSRWARRARCWRRCSTRRRARCRRSPTARLPCTVVQKPFEFGYLASKWMHELATKGEAARAAIPAGKMIDTGVEVITKDNVAEFSKQLAALKK